MDANNVNILWTEASWVGNKTLTPHYPNQRNCLYLKWTHSKTHKFILQKEKWNNTSIPDQNKKKNMPWSYMESLLSCHKLGWLSGPQWNLEGHRVAVRRVVRLHRNREKRKNSLFFFKFVWTWCGVYGYERLVSMGWTCVHPSSLEEEGKERRGGRKWKQIYGFLARGT